MPEQDPLAQLRDIHLPEAIGMWPPAPGWWFLATLIIAGIVYLTYRINRHIRDNRYRKLALNQLTNIDAATQNSTQFLQLLNQLLKRTALAAAPAANVAGLSGEDWLAFLDQSANTSEFSDGIGKVLLHGPYQPSSVSGSGSGSGSGSNSSINQTIDKPALKQLVQSWIKGHTITGSVN